MQLEREELHLVEYFNSACAWLCAHNLPMPKIDLMHLELMPNKNHFRMSGFHHDYLGQLEKSGIIRLEILQKYSNGFYEAKIWIAGTPVNERKTFFPQIWTRERVIKCVTETYQNCVKQNILPEYKPGGKSLLKGMISRDVELHFYLDQKMNIKTVYPVLIRKNV